MVRRTYLLLCDTAEQSSVRGQCADVLVQDMAEQGNLLLSTKAAALRAGGLPSQGAPLYRTVNMSTPTALSSLLYSITDRRSKPKLLLNNMQLSGGSARRHDWCTVMAGDQRATLQLDDLPQDSADWHQS